MVLGAKYGNIDTNHVNSHKKIVYLNPLHSNTTNLYTIV